MTSGPARGLARPSASAPFLEMAGRKMRADEIAAAEIVAAYLDGNPEARDVEGAPDKTHDFDVVLRTGQRIALEVTAAVDEARVSLDHAHPVRTDRSTATIPHPGRKRCPVEWATPIIAWRPGAAQLFSWLQLGPGARKCARGRCSGIESRKLAAADVDERHLFVWMDPSNSSAEAAVSLGRPFGAPVALPIAIDVVWLATAGVPNSGAVAFAGIGVMALWRVRLGAIEWESLPLRVLARASVAEP